MRCTSCNFENPEDMSFCGKCGTLLTPCCPQCGFVSPADFAFCGKCGSPLAQPTEKSQQAKSKARFAPKSTTRKRQSQTKWQATEEPRPVVAEAERRQLTVLFCDLVGSTALSAQLDPEEYREVVRMYQQASAAVIERFEGYLAQYLGDGLLVYFGYPTAHEDDAARAVRVGLRIIEAVQALKARLTHPLQVRIGIHTGIVVVGEIGGGYHQEQLALGEAPNIAARIQGQAEPNTVVISVTTYRLVEGLFECDNHAHPALKGVATPLTLYRVVKEEEAQSRFQVALRTGLTPLVGRTHELGLLQERWERAKRADGQVVMLSGEPGIGKSRLVEMLKAHVSQEGATRIEFRCSPYYQNSALYPVTEHLQRLLQFERDDPPGGKLAKLQRTLSRYRFPQRDTFPLLAALLSLPHPEGSPALTMSAQKQKERTLEVLVSWLVEEAEQAPVYCVWEDLHWADPSTLEVLGLLLDQVPTARLLVLLTFRPEFTALWGTRSHLNHLTLTRLTFEQAAEMVKRVSGGQTLPPALVQQVVTKTDGVPLFVEELTKAVVEAGAGTGQVSLHAIPSTLLDSLMARLDRLGSAKEIAQWGATLGREFSYEVLHVVARMEEARLREGLRQLVGAELVYQHGLPPQARYLFKHALIQDAAYQSLLKSTRQQYHQQIAHVLEERFPETKETQPELLAHHYTEAGLLVHALPYWQRAGEKAARKSAHAEAISHLTKGLEVLATLPDTRERACQELALQAALGPVLIAVKGWSAPENEAAYKRARELCEQIGDTTQLFPVLYGECTVYGVRPELQTLRELSASFLALAHQHQDAGACIEGSFLAGYAAFFLADLPVARAYLEQAITLYGPQPRPEIAEQYGHDGGMSSQFFAACTLWLLGYPEQSRVRAQETVSLAQSVGHPFTLAYAHGTAALAHQLRRDTTRVREQAEAGILLSREQGFPHFLGFAQAMQGWVLSEEGQGEAGIELLRQGAAGWRSQGSELWRPYWLALLAEAHGKVGQVDEGLANLAEALRVVEQTQEAFYEAELYRLKGELMVHAHGHGLPSRVEAEACFHKAIEVARKQQARSLELRAVMSLVRLWQQQDKSQEAHQLLSEIYGWFTEGFDTKDLQEAKALLEELR
jgi:class 3 adenylate cyclase/predicted ATPase